MLSFSRPAPRRTIGLCFFVATLLCAAAPTAAAPDSLYAATYGGGVFKSVDAGATWAPINNGLTAQGLYVTALVADTVDSTTFYAGTQDGVFRTVDAGATWTPLSNGMVLTGLSTITHIIIDPTDNQTIYAGSGNFGDGVFKTVDGGANWAPANVGLVTSGNLDVRGLVIDPLDPDTLYVTGVTGLETHKTTDGAATWTSIRTGFHHSLAIDPVFPDTLYLGQLASIQKSVDGGLTWNGTGGGLADFIVDLVVDPSDSSVVYAANSAVGGAPDLLYKSVNGGGAWAPSNTGLTGSGILDIVFDPSEADTLYAGGYDGVFVSTDGAATWTSISTGLPAMRIEAVALGFSATPFEAAAEVVQLLSGPGGPLNKGQATALLENLGHIESQADAGNLKTACNQLRAFLNRVRAFVRSGVLTPAEAAPLLDAADEIAAAIPCP